MADIKRMVRDAVQRIPFVGGDYLTRSERFRIYDKIGSSIYAGETLIEALQHIHEFITKDGEKPDTRQARVIRKWIPMAMGGETIDVIVRDYAPDSEVSMLATGAEAKLPDAISDLINVSGSMNRMTSGIGKAIMYPVSYALASSAFVIVFAVYLAPQFYISLPFDKWETEPALMVYVGTFLADFWYLVLLIIAAAAVLIMWSLPNWTGPWRKKFDRLPPWSFYKMYYGASFMLMLSALRAIGKTDQEVIDTMLVYASPWLRERLLGADYYIKGGLDIGTALSKSDFDFPDAETIIDLRSRAKKTGFPEFLRKTSERWLTKAEKRIEMQASTLKIVGMLMFALVIVGFMMAINSIQGQMGDLQVG